MVFYGRGQSTRNLGQNRGEDVGVRFSESGCLIFRATRPLSSGQLVNCRFSFYGAVAEMCEEDETIHDRSGRPNDVVMGQSNCAQCNQDRSSF